MCCAALYSPVQNCEHLFKAQGLHQPQATVDGTLLVCVGAVLMLPLWHETLFAHMCTDLSVIIQSASS